MPTLTSTGAVNLTSSTNWSPALVPTTGDDLIIAAHTLTLDADMTLNSVTFSNASSRLAISGTSRSVQSTTGWYATGSIGARLITTAIPSGTSLTLTGEWINTTNNSFSIAASTGGNLTLRTVGASQSSNLFTATGTQQCVITSSWTGGVLTTIGLIGIGTGSSSIVAITGGTWNHQSVGINSFGTGQNRIAAISGTGTINWTGSVDSQSGFSSGGFNGIFNLSSSSVSNTIGQAGDTFCLRNAPTNATLSLVQLSSGTVELIGQFTGQGDAVVLVINGSGALARYRNQSVSIPSTDTMCLMSGNSSGTVDLSGLVVTNSGKFLLHEIGGGSTTASAGTSITNTSASATACAWGTHVLDGRIVTLASDPPTLPAVQNVASGTSYGYSGSPLTGTGLILDPAVLASAMTTSLNTISPTSTARIADGVLTRNVSNVESTAGEHTLATAILGMLEWEISGNDLIIKRTDGTTVHYTKTLSSATGTGDVITGLN